MPHYGNTRLYVGHLSSRTCSRDLERLFSKYGRVRDVDMKRHFAFVDFSDPRDADDARDRLDGRDFDGNRIVVEFEKKAIDCTAGDRKKKCYRCGDSGHRQRNCKNSPKELKRDQSYSRSPGRSRSPPRRRRNRSRSRSRSYSRSRSPVRNDKEQTPEPAVRTRSYGSTRLFVGHLSFRTSSRDVERLFSKYGRVLDVAMKRGFAFVDFSDPRDADDARYCLDGRDFDGSRIFVEFGKGMPRGSGSCSLGSGRCFNCGLDGHLARDCTAGDCKNKCYHCGDRGHIQRNCKNSPKELKRDQSYSRSPGRSQSPPRRRRNRSRSRSRSLSRSYSRSRSPVRTEKEQTPEPAARTRSSEPMVHNSPPLKKYRSRSLSPNENSPVPENNDQIPKGQENSEATNGQGHSPDTNLVPENIHKE